MRRIVQTSFLVIVAAIVVEPADAQESGLYVVTGTPNNKGGFGCYCESELFKLSPGNLTLIRRLATQERKGLHSVLPDYDRGVVFVASPGEGYPDLEAISMRNPTRIVKRPAVAREIPDNAWVPWPPSPYPIRLPPGPPVLTSMRLVGSGPEALVRLSFGDERGRADAVYAWSDATSTLALRPTSGAAISQVRIHGEFGFPGSGMGDSDLELITHAAGRWVVQQVPIDLPVISDLPAESSTWRLLARTDEATVIRLQPTPRKLPPAALRAPGVPTLRIYRASTKKWQPLDGVGSDPRLRLIGQWLLMITGDEKRGRVTNPGSAELRQPPEGRWHDERVKRPVTAGRFLHEEAYYPGLLVIMDTRTGKSWRINSDQGDSEPLLASGTSIYYRVNDKILKAELQQNGQVGKPTLLAQSDELRDAHWAFLGPQ